MPYLLLENPEHQCKRLCEFLCIKFELSMLTFSISPENHGAAKGEKKIIRNNKNKYKIMLSKKTLNKIELISYPTLKSLGYEVNDCKREAKHLSKIEMIYYKILDGINLFKFRYKERGFWNSIIFQLNFFKIKQ